MAEAASGDAREPCGGSQPMERFEAKPLHAQPTRESNPAASGIAGGGAPAVGHKESSSEERLQSGCTLSTTRGIFWRAAGPEHNAEGTSVGRLEVRADVLRVCARGFDALRTTVHSQ